MPVCWCAGGFGGARPGDQVGSPYDGDVLWCLGVDGSGEDTSELTKFWLLHQDSPPFTELIEKPGLENKVEASFNTPGLAFCFNSCGKDTSQLAKFGLVHGHLPPFPIEVLTL